MRTAVLATAAGVISIASFRPACSIAAVGSTPISALTSTKPSTSSSTESVSIVDALRSVADGTGALDGFSVTYSDLHPLWGGLELTLYGNGEVRQKAERVKAGRTRRVSESDIRAVGKSLVEHRAWEQRTPERAPAPDESRTILRITCANQSTLIWEWSNDVQKSQRIGSIRAALTAAAWEPGTEK